MLFARALPCSLYQYCPCILQPWAWQGSSCRVQRAKASCQSRQKAVGGFQQHGGVMPSGSSSSLCLQHSHPHLPAGWSSWWAHLYVKADDFLISAVTTADELHQGLGVEGVPPTTSTPVAQLRLRDTGLSAVIYQCGYICPILIYKQSFPDPAVVPLNFEETSLRQDSLSKIFLSISVLIKRW